MRRSSDLDLPVVRLAAIYRGGVISSVVGDHAVLGEAEARRVAGYVVTKCRGDASLFDDGLAIVTARTGWPALGVAPFFPDARSEERRVGKECVSTCRSRWSTYH